MSLLGVLDIFSRKFESPPIIPHELVKKIKSAEEVSDDDFDRIFPHYYRIVSQMHWSSIEVARIIGSWITPLERRSFIDIGCGVGKLCILLRFLTDIEIHGIEQRKNLVEIANEIVNHNYLSRISIIHLNMLDLNWDDFDIYYLYNPFQEHIVDTTLGIIERNLSFDKKHFVQYTSEVFRQLTWAKPGKVLITFHGFGGNVPRGWRMTASRHVENGELTMWIKE